MRILHLPVVFDTSHAILSKKCAGIIGTALNWFSSSDRSFKTHITNPCMLPYAVLMWRPPRAQSSPCLLCVHICGPWSCSLWFYGISVAIGQTHQCYADDTQLYLIYSAASPASVNALRLLIQCIRNFVDLTPGSEHNSVCRLWGEGGSQYQPCSPSLRAPVILKSAIKVKLFLTLLT